MIIGRHYQGWGNFFSYGGCLDELEGSNSTQGRALLRNPTLCHRIGERHKTA